MPTTYTFCIFKMDDDNIKFWAVSALICVFAMVCWMIVLT